MKLVDVEVVSKCLRNFETSNEYNKGIMELVAQLLDSLTPAPEEVVFEYLMGLQEKKLGGNIDERV